MNPVPAVSSVPSWYRRLYAKVESYSQSPYATWAMLLVAFIDGSFFPVPPFALMVPMVLAHPRAWVRLSLLGTLASIAGGLLGYYLGHSLGHAAEELLHVDLSAPLSGRVPGALGLAGRSVGEILGTNFWLLALAASILPTPFKVVAIGSGLVQVPLARFLLASVLGRAFRFFAVGGVLAVAGPRSRKWLRM